jgi:hypothetical protein
VCAKRCALVRTTGRDRLTTPQGQPHKSPLAVTGQRRRIGPAGAPTNAGPSVIRGSDDDLHLCRYLARRARSDRVGRKEPQWQKLSAQAIARLSLLKTCLSSTWQTSMRIRTACSADIAPAIPLSDMKMEATSCSAMPTFSGLAMIPHRGNRNDATGTVRCHRRSAL